LFCGNLFLNNEIGALSTEILDVGIGQTSNIFNHLLKELDLIKWLKQ